MAASRPEPSPLSELFDSALQHLAPSQTGDGYLYAGNPHESVPRALLLDRRLTPLERNAWQVFRMQLNADGVTAFPTYEQLRPYLASMPCAANASHETVARALALLRLTRWLTLVRRRRDPRTGRIQGNLYVLHDEPLTPFEAMQLDPDYLSLVSQALTHAAKAVQIVGQHVLEEIAGDPLLRGRTLPTRLQVLAKRMTTHDQTESYPQHSAGQESEERANDSFREDLDPASESEASEKPFNFGPLRIPKQDRTVRSSRIIEVHTLPRARAAEQLRVPARFQRLRQEQQTGAMVALRQVEPGQRQAVLDEWAIRCGTGTVRNPAGYLFGVIQRAIRGEFNAWASTSSTSPLPSADRGIASKTPTPSSPAPPPADPETVRTHLDRMRAMLHPSRE